MVSNSGKNLFLSLLCLLILAMVPFLSFAKGSDKTELKMEATVQKNGFLGEVLTYEVKLYSTDPNISNVRAVSAPSYPAGCHIISGATRNGARKVKKDGKEFYCWTILRSFIIPSEVGKMSVSKATYVVFIPRESVVNDRFWGLRRITEYEEVTIGCNSVDFKIAPLPKEDSENFSGCVGDFKIEGWFPPGNIHKGNEAYAMFSISGYGSLRDVKIPNLYRLFGTGCHLKEVEQNEEQMQRDGRLFSQITLTCRFVAEDDEFVINPLSLIFFNPETKKYYDASSDALQWTHHPSKGNGSSKADAIEI